MILTSKPLFHRARFAAIALCALAAGACGNTEPATSIGVLHAERGWIRATPPNAPVAGGYMTLRNDGGVDDRVITLSSPLAARVEMHEMRMQGGAMQMRALPDGIAVKAGESVELEPGGTHLMFIGAKRVLKAGEQVKVTLTYAKAPPQTLAFVVQPLGSTTAPTQSMSMPADADAHSHH